MDLSVAMEVGKSSQFLNLLLVQMWSIREKKVSRMISGFFLAREAENKEISVNEMDQITRGTG